VVQQQRWLEITASPYPHEVEGLGRVRAVLPDQPPFRAWTNFEFRDGQGKWQEVDLLVLGRRRLHLVELKYYSGTLRGDDHRWLREGHRAEDSPLKLARRKAQRLSSKLKDELLRWARENGQAVPDPRDVVPFVQEAVFLHHPDMRCALPTSARLDLFGIDGDEARSGLVGISDRLLEGATPQQAVAPGRDAVIAQLMANIGVVQRRQRDVGSWTIDGEPLGEGEGWQDWPAFHRVSTTQRGRIRFRVTPPGTSASQRELVRRVATHEYGIMSRLAHDGLLRPGDLVDDELGVGLVYPDDPRFQRLDLWLADQPAGIALEQQLSIVRQVAEALAYAHGSRVVHRGLTPQSVRVRTMDDQAIRAVVADWQGAGNLGATPLTGVSGITNLAGAAEATERLDDVLHPGLADIDRFQAQAFQAPEGVWSPKADRVRLDVFALGALTYALLAGKSPAADRSALRARLTRDDGLDLAADLPQVSSALRSLVLRATRPVVSARSPDVRSFLEMLADAERSLHAAGEDALDPLDATPGAILDRRFRLTRRLGAGSTAVGLLVTDLTIADSGPDATRVLKVALDDTAATRLSAEAEVLRSLDDPRLVRLVEGPLEVAGRRALLLESAGEQTLAEQLQGRARLSLDLLERWGSDLLEGVVALDRAGVDHRDIKPANLGVREGRGDRKKHLVLFDFSLTRAGAGALTAGTPPYLDPFLESRGRYDSAAERYAAAVVLFEMATGSPPVYGDGLSDPAMAGVEATVDPAAFDTSLADSLAQFFRCALAREVAHRHDTAVDMLADWQSVFRPLPTTVPDDAEERTRAAVPSTPLVDSGLSARALSALEQFAVRTVGDLIVIDPVRLNRMAGVAEPTRREVKDQAKRWRDRLGAEAPGHGSATAQDEDDLLDPANATDVLLAPLPAKRAPIARMLLGADDGLDAFASRLEIAQAAGLTRAQADQQLAALQQSWTSNSACRELLELVGRIASTAIDAAGGVATVDELTREVSTCMVSGPTTERTAAGLVRLALDRLHDAHALSSRRRDGRLALLATQPTLLDAAEALGREADRLVAQAQLAGEPVVGARRAVEPLRTVVLRIADAGPVLTEDARLLRLAAALSHDAAVSGAGELHHRDLPPAAALGLALKGVGGTQPLPAQEIRGRVRARFPALAALPDRPRLDELVEEAQLGLIFDEQLKAYRTPTRAPDTTGLAPRVATRVVKPGVTLVEGGHLGHRLTESVATRSFLALGVDAGRLDRATRVLVEQFAAQQVDVTQVLIEAMRRAAVAVNLPWDLVRAADAAQPHSNEARGLAVLVQRAVPAVHEAVEAAAAQGIGPVVLTEVSPLARYDHLASLSRWTDLTAPRAQAVWLLVPQLLGSQGATIDGRPLPLAAPGQFHRLDAEWVDTRAATATTQGA
jgi:serine/threonine protein kinase